MAKERECGRKTKLNFDLSKLSNTEKMYFEVMISGTPIYIRGFPGNAKSAMGRSICAKVIWWREDGVKHTGLNYIDLRLSDKDETDLGSYPVTQNPLDQLIKFSKLLGDGHIDPDEFNKIKEKYLSVIITTSDVTSLSFAIPDWALESNTHPTIIHVEELNRCDVKVRNASLQLLNENQIGSFKFNDDVFWMSSGNLGEEDRTEVEEMDLALSNRLCIIDHDLTEEEWAENYGFENCWSAMVDYLLANRKLFVKPAPEEVRYATARSWTNLSNYIFSTYGEEPNLEIVSSSNNMSLVGLGFIGASWTGFSRYLMDTSRININDIIDNWEKVKKDVGKLNRARTMELMSNLRSIKIQEKNKEQVHNIINFLKVLAPDNISENDTKSHSNDDEVTSYILYLVDKMEPENQKFHKYVIKQFTAKAKIIHKWVNNGRHKNEDGTLDLTYEKDKD